MVTYAHNADWKTAPTRHVEAAGIRFAYRRLGPNDGVPVVLLNHWGGRGSNQGHTRSRVDAARAGDSSLIFSGWLVQDGSMR
jgi:hypothetical protein